MAIIDYLQENWACFQAADAFLPRDNPTFQNPAFAAAPLRVLIARLSPYRDVERSTPHLFLYQSVRRAVPDAYVDLAFFPPEHDRARLLEAEVPLLFGTQSLRPVQDFDLVLISNAYTLELINLPYLLLHSDLALMASARRAGDPLLILGGSNALAAQALLAPDGDSVVDALFFGEGEGQVETLVRTLSAHRSLPRRERLERAAEHVLGLWPAGDLERRATKAICPRPDADDLLIDYPLLNGEEAGTARLQINFGCPAFCAFCFEGYDRKPYREIPKDEVLATADRLKAAQGAEVLELYSFNFNTHADIFDLLLELNQRFNRVSVKSQRVDLLYETPRLLHAEVLADKRSFTLGVEGISARLRAFLHKSLSTEAIVGTLTALLQEKIREIKLFYILTGHETEDDLDEFHDFIAALKVLHRRHNPGIRVVVSAGRLVRMPFTPLRYDRLFLEADDWTQIVGPVKSAVETHGFEFRMATPWADYCTSQVLALGGTWLLKPIRQLAEAGYCYDTRLEPAYWEALRTWMKNHGRWTPALLGEKGPDYAFPLAFLDQAIDAGFLYDAFEDAQAGVDRGYCLGDANTPGHCLNCGACSTPEQRRALLTHHIHRPTSPDYWRQLPQRMRTKWRRDPVHARIHVPALACHTDPAWLNAWVLRFLLNAYPELRGNLLTAEEALFTHHAQRDRFPTPGGDLIFALGAWDVDDLLWILAGPREEGEAGTVFRGLVDDFVPGTFEEASLQLTLPTAHFPRAGQRLRRYLQSQYVPNNVRREGRTYHFELSKKALKKRMLLGGSYEMRGDAVYAQLRIGPKFDLLSYFKALNAPRHQRKIRVIVTGLTW